MMSEVKQGRPSKYKEDFLFFARRLVLMGHSDIDVAFVLGVDIETLAYWAWEYEEFYNAITPDEKAILEYKKEIDLKNKRAEARRARKREYQKRKRAESISFRLENSIRARMNHALRGRVKSQSIRDLPYSVDELMRHLESRFKNGMTWGNYGEWHIDHVKPCSLFDHSIKEQFQECWDLNNLQPLWASENLSKGDRYDCTNGK